MAGPIKLTGTIIGTPGSWNNSGNTIAKAFDGNFSTFFDAPAPGNGAWVGLDLGTTAQIAQVKYAPRATYESRMVGGRFEGSNTADFSSGVVNLFTISSAPVAGSFTTQAITNTGTFRYVRYLSPNGGYGNIAELEFDGTPANPTAPTAPTGLTATAGNSQVALAWNAASGATSYNIYRATTAGGEGEHALSHRDHRPSFTDTGLTNGTRYFYQVSAVNAAGQSGKSSEVSAVPQVPGANGLVLALGFNEGTGVTVTDSSGNSNSGTLSGATWSTSGKFGNALSFNGSNALVSIADSASLDLTTGMTLEAWVNPSATSSAWRDVIYKGPNDIYYLEGSSPQAKSPAMGGTFSFQSALRHGAAGGQHLVAPGGHLRRSRRCGCTSTACRWPVEPRPARSRRPRGALDRRRQLVRTVLRRADRRGPHLQPRFVRPPDPDRHEHAGGQPPAAHGRNDRQLGRSRAADRLRTSAHCSTKQCRAGKRHSATHRPHEN